MLLVFCGNGDASLTGPIPKILTVDLTFSAVSSPLKTHLHHAGARVEEDAAFGFLGDLLVFVEVHDVGVVCQLGELKVSPLERLCRIKKRTLHCFGDTQEQ